MNYNNSINYWGIPLSICLKCPRNSVDISSSRQFVVALVHDWFYILFAFFSYRTKPLLPYLSIWSEDITSLPLNFDSTTYRFPHNVFISRSDYVVGWKRCDDKNKYKALFIETYTRQLCPLWMTNKHELYRKYCKRDSFIHDSKHIDIHQYLLNQLCWTH